MIGFTALVLVTLAMAVICHRQSRRLLLVSFVVASVATVVHQVIGFLALGYLDPFWFIALPLGGMVAFSIALLVGVVVRMLKRHETKRPDR